MSQKTAIDLKKPKRKVKQVKEPNLKVETVTHSGAIDFKESNISVDKIYSTREAGDLLYGSLKQPGEKIINLINAGLLKGKKEGRRYWVTGFALKDFVVFMRNGGDQ